MSWEFVEDLTNIEPVSTGRPPTVSGPYKVKVGPTEMTQSAAGNDRVRWTNLVLDGDFAGCEIFDGINLPNFDDEKTNKFIRSLWVNFLVAIGNPKKKVQKKLKIAPKLMDGKTGYIQFTTKEDAGGEYSSVHWITKSQYEALKKAAPAPEDVELEEVNTGTNVEEFEDDDDDDDDDDPLDALDI